MQYISKIVTQSNSILKLQYSAYTVFVFNALVLCGVGSTVYYVYNEYLSFGERHDTSCDIAKTNAMTLDQEKNHISQGISSL